MSLNYGTTINRSNLELFLDVANPKSFNGGATWKDLSGNSRNATISGAPQVSGKWLSFDGVDDYAEIDPSIKAVIEASADFTLITISNLKFIEHIDNLVGWGNANTDGSGYSRTFGQWGNSVNLRTSYQGPVFGSGALINVPLMYVSRYDDHVLNSKTFGSLEIDASSDFTGSTTTTWKGISEAHPVTIGKTSYYGRFMEVDISVVMMYSRYVSNLELQSLFESFRGRYNL